jgi:phosphatidylserine/phosphatidylglycerophosphate/cardiolipin synthase-like enzyme
VTIAVATPVQAATPGPVFNRPDDVARQYEIVSHWEQMIDETAPGAIIRMAFYSITVQSFVDKLIAAHNRGVQVKLLMDDHTTSPQWTQLVAALGTNPNSASGSFAVLCHRSCFTDYEPSYLHAKMYMFSSTGASSRVVSVSSANPTNGQAVIGWNNTYTMVGDRTQYNSYKQYFEDMLAGARNNNQSTAQPAGKYRTTDTGAYKSYFFPRQGTTTATDTVQNILDNVTCTGTAAGYGTAKGRTIIKVAMFQWTQYRVNLARKLWNLDNAGCNVEIIYSKVETDQAVIDALRKPGGAFGGPVVRDGSKDVDGNGTNDLYVHHKYFIIDGNYAGDRSSRLVFTGSANFANNALRYNNEIILKVNEAATYEAFRVNFVEIRDFITAPAVLAAAPAAPAPLTPNLRTTGVDPIPYVTSSSERIANIGE